MALRNAAAGNYWWRTRQAGAQTLMAWMLYETATAYDTLIQLDESSWYGTSSSGANIHLYDGLSDWDGAAISTNVWHHVCITSTGDVITTDTVNLYFDRALSINQARTANAATGTAMAVAGDGSQYGTVQWDAVKQWSRVLTLDEIIIESYEYMPVFSDGCIGVWNSLVGATSANRVKDLSGNGRDMTEAGTPTEVDGPPISWSAGLMTIPELPVVAGGFGQLFAHRRNRLVMA